MNVQEFQEMLWTQGRELFRDMPWRADTQPYYVLVSELMLQQTQVDRVVSKFEAFIDRFPDEQALATASLSDVLIAWQGLGYNRRAKYLHDAAKKIVKIGVFPDTQDGLVSLPGVGPNTAGAILAYSFNQPVVYVETNVRTVYIHHFFADADQIDDRDIRVLIEQTIDQEHPREFYWAIMDYGSYLKRQGVKSSSRSRHYVRQSPLEGSVRQVRGQILKALAGGPKSEVELSQFLNADDRFSPALGGLIKDGLVEAYDQTLRLTKGL